MIRHETQCRDCGFTFYLEDAEWCIHYHTEGKGSKGCPQCHNCICHGEKFDQIKDRFDNNIKVGKFIPCGDNPFGWNYMCKTVKRVEVSDDTRAGM